MELKTKNKNTNKKWFVITLFFALSQISQVNIALAVSITAEEMINLTNKSRTEAGLGFLLVNEKLTEAAKEKADNMFESQYFDHNSPNGLTPWDFIRSAGYDYIYAGENLAIDFVTAGGAHKALMESSSHRENILNSNYTEIGIAAVEGIFDGNKSIIIVEEFGTPLKEESVTEQNENIEFVFEENLKDDDLSLGDLDANFDILNPAFRLFENSQDKTLYNNYETLKGKFQQFGTQLSGCSLDEEKEREAVLKYNPTLMAGSLSNEKVRGLISKAYAKDEHIKKYDYRQEPISYFQNEFASRVLLFYFILAALLAFDFIFIVCYYRDM